MRKKKNNKKISSLILFSLSVIIIILCVWAIFSICGEIGTGLDKIDTYTIYNETSALSLAKISAISSFGTFMILIIFAFVHLLGIWSECAADEGKKLVK